MFPSVVGTISRRFFRRNLMEDWREGTGWEAGIKGRHERKWEVGRHRGETQRRDTEGRHRGETQRGDTEGRKKRKKRR